MRILKQLLQNPVIYSYYKNRIAFTLAEVLITLLIIGVIASLTIPVITRKIQEADLKTAFKKSYSDIAQATDTIITNNGGSFKYLCDSADHTCLANLYKKHLNTLRICPGGTGTLLGNCWHKDNEWKELDGDNKSGFDGGDAGLVLNNGVLLDFWATDYSCDSDYRDSSFPAGSFFICGVIEMDVNGFKPPNVIGRDIFRTYIQEFQHMPGGASTSEYDITKHPCDINNVGWSCATKVLQGN